MQNKPYKRRFRKMPYQLPPYTLAQAKTRVMDLIATRDHSVREIKNKLRPRCSDEILSQTLEWAQEQSWFPSETRVQEMFVRNLSLRKKGQNYINAKLKEKGLKPVKIETETEEENALASLAVKFKENQQIFTNFKEMLAFKAKVMRFLVGRGFSARVATETFKKYFIIEIEKG